MKRFLIAALLILAGATIPAFADTDAKSTTEATVTIIEKHPADMAKLTLAVNKLGLLKILIEGLTPWQGDDHLHAGSTLENDPYPPTPLRIVAAKQLHHEAEAIVTVDLLTQTAFDSDYGEIDQLTDQVAMLLLDMIYNP
jgi:hypothetical protein